MEKSSFFNAEILSTNPTVYDRQYSAETFAEYFASFIGNGIFPNPSTNLQLVSSTAMSTILKSGTAWINGYFYANTEDLILTHDVADGVLNRIDRVVVRLDFLNREIKAYIKKGIPASMPTAPSLQRDANMHELGIADVSINAGLTTILQSNITDLRMNDNYCGIVAGTVDQIDTTNLFAQYDDSFNTWFQTLKNVLDENTAANLLNQINDLAGIGRTTETIKGNADAINNLAGAGRTTETVKGVSDAVAEHTAESATDAHKISNITNLQSTLDAKVKLGTANTDLQKIITFLLPTDTRSWTPTTFDATTPTKPTHIDIKDGVTVVATLDMTWNADGNITSLIASDGVTTVTYTVSWTGGVWQGTTKAVT